MRALLNASGPYLRCHVGVRVRVHACVRVCVRESRRNQRQLISIASGSTTNTEVVAGISECLCMCTCMCVRVRVGVHVRPSVRVVGRQM